MSSFKNGKIIISILTGACFQCQQWIWASQMLTLKRCFNKASATKKVYRIMIENPSTTGTKFPG